MFEDVMSVVTRDAVRVCAGSRIYSEKYGYCIIHKIKKLFLSSSLEVSGVVTKNSRPFILLEETIREEFYWDKKNYLIEKLKEKRESVRETRLTLEHLYIELRALKEQIKIEDRLEQQKVPEKQDDAF